MNVKTILTPILLFTAVFFNAQNIFLTKVEKTKENKDKYFVKVDLNNPSAEYLGEIDVQGFSNNDMDVFERIYNKAKEIGANAFAYQPFETVDEKIQPFNPSNYKIRLYYISKEEYAKPSEIIYLFSSSGKSQTISINKKDFVMPSRSFTAVKTISGEIYTISTKKFLGSTIKVQGKSESPAQYYQVSSLKIRSNTFGEPGVNLKSGDILGLDRSFGDFLRMIYTENK